MMDKNTSVEQLLSFYMEKKHTRPPRIYYQEFEEGRFDRRSNLSNDDRIKSILPNQKQVITLFNK
jgi:DNA-binding PadR family transcriptional regulator